MVVSEPLLPLGLVNGIALVENVVEKSLNSVVQVLCVNNIVEVEEFTWDSTGLNSTFSTVSFRSWEVAGSRTEFFLVGFTESEHFLGELGESSSSIVLLADLDTSGVDGGVQIGPAWFSVFHRAQSVVEVSRVGIIEESIWTGKWWPAHFHWVAVVAILAFAGESSVSVDADSGFFVASVSSSGALVFRSCALFSVADVALFTTALAVVAIVSVKAIGIVVALVSSFNALVDGDRALVSVSDVVILADALVTSLDVDTISVLVALVHTLITFIDLWLALSTVSVEAFLALALESGVSLTVDGSLGNAVSVGVAVVVAILTVVWLVASCFPKFVKFAQVELGPFVVTVGLDLIDDSFECVDPFAGSGILGVIDPLASNDTSFWCAADSSSSFTKLGKLSGDLIPVMDGSLMIVRSLEGNGFEFFVGEGGVLGEVALSGLGVVRMGTFGTVSVHINVSIGTVALVTLKGVDAIGIVTTVVRVEHTFVLLLLAVAVSVDVPTALECALAIVASFARFAVWLVV